LSCRFCSEVNNKFNTNLNQRIATFFNLDEDQTLQVLENLKENLNKGVFRFVVLMDRLEQKLKDLIRFINHNSQFDLYAVELDYYKFEEHELILDSSPKCNCHFLKEYHIRR